jgi:hypothetical protein
MKDLRHYAGKAPPHLCMDGHEPIGCWDMEGEQCPVCRMKGALEAIRELFDGEADASCEPGDDRFRPNRAMQVDQIIDRVLPT